MVSVRQEPEFGISNIAFGSLLSGWMICKYTCWLTAFSNILTVDNNFVKGGLKVIYCSLQNTGALSLQPHFMLSAKKAHMWCRIILAGFWEPPSPECWGSNWLAVGSQLRWLTLQYMLVWKPKTILTHFANDYLVLSLRLCLQMASNELKTSTFTDNI